MSSFYKNPNQVYFKTTTHYDLEVDGRPLTVRLETDSNESHVHYKNGDDWSESPPEWILEIGENWVVMMQTSDHLFIKKFVAWPLHKVKKPGEILSKLDNTGAVGRAYRCE